MTTLAMLSLAAFAADSPPATHPEEQPPTVKVSGLLYAHYGFDLTEGQDDFNSFDLDRTYLRLDAKLTDQLSTRLTLDSNREDSQTVALADGTEVDVPGDSRLRVFVKHAWLSWKASDAFELKGGMVDTPFLPFTEAYQGLRWTARTFLDDNKLESTTDLGVMATGKVAEGRFSYGVGVYNGEFFSKPEVGSGKSVQVRLTVDPLAGGERKISLPISGFVDENLHEDPVGPALTWAGDVGFAHPNLLVQAQVAGRSQDGVSGLGQSFQLVPRVPDVGYLYTRLDHWDPDGAAADDGDVKVIGGVGHDFFTKVSLGVQYEQTMYEAADATPVRGVFLRTQAGF
jgi:hypothetical protein